MRVIAIDGPAGTGKSTVARAVARRLGLDHLDTGAMYRAVGAAALARGIDPADDAAVAALAERAELEVDAERVTIDGRDVTVEVRGPAVTAVVSAVAANPAVRRRLVEAQRRWAVERDGGVLDGRDIGTVVFPDAPLKVYLVATSEVRAARRAAEGVAGSDGTAVAADLARRDRLDSSRADSPLAAAADALVIDTSALSIDEVVEEILLALKTG